MSHQEVSMVQVAERSAAAGRGSGTKRIAVSERLRSDWRIGLAAAAVLAAVFAVAAAGITPRGPVTTAEALWTMGIAALVGAGAGAAMGSRWAMLAAPAVFAVVFEFARIPTSGPTVDGIDLGSPLGIIAFVTGRVAHGVLALAPMAVGASWGVWAVRRFGGGPQRSMGPGGWVLTVTATVALVVVAAAVARPATTAPIIGPDGGVVAGSIAELTTVEIGGHDQALMIRGRSTDAPVLLYLAGGPGGTDLGAIRADTALEQSFVVVAWDQRGAGRSYPSLDPIGTLTLDRAVADLVEVTDYLRGRFGVERIYLAGNSWGTTLGVLAVGERPDLFAAFVGIGQMVSQRETDVMFWEDTLDWALRTGRDSVAERLRANGPPPYEDVSRYSLAVSHEHDWNPYPEFDPGTEMPAILMVPEYSWIERINGFRGFLDSAAVLYPQLQDLDFRRTATSLDVPVYVVLGEHEARGRDVLARQWFDMLEAPSKELIVFEGAGHRAHFDQPARFAELMERVLAETTASPRP